jgi:hypothetical protein
MSKQNTLDRLNRVADLFVRGRPPQGTLLGARTYGGDEESSIALIGKNVKAFDLAVDELLPSLPNVKGTVSRKVCLDELIPRIREKKNSGKVFALDEAEQFENVICRQPICKFRVIRRIYGVALPHDGGTVSIGDFLIGFGRQLFGIVQKGSLLALTLKPEDLDQLFIECTVEAREAERAVEIADSLFHRFELIFRVFIGRRNSHIEVGILNFIGPRIRGRFVIADNGQAVSHGSSLEGAFQPFLLNDPRFPMPNGPFIRLFQLISRENSEFEKHVIRCAEWTGQAIADANAASALVKAAIALEVMFSTNEKGVITPSIMAQIAESCAFLLCNEQISPLEIEHDVRHLYGIRSSVVHSGKDSVEDNDLNWFIEICRSIVIVMLSKEEFADTKTMAKLTEYFKNRKYSVLMGTKQDSSHKY